MDHKKKKNLGQQQQIILPKSIVKEIGKMRAEANKVEHRTEWKESKLNALWYFLSEIILETYISSMLNIFLYVKFSKSQDLMA